VKTFLRRDLRLFIPSKQAEVLAMAFHELATNAVKHGALSRKDGRVEVTWYAARAQQGQVVRH
jgi:two-component sensor histidine kinase